MWYYIIQRSCFRVEFDFENKIRDKGYKYICGIDEAGRGPLAGDVFAAAVILPEEYIPLGLNDSKKLTESKREKLFDEIIENALSYAISFSTVAEIDEINILESTLLAMRRAVANLSILPDKLLIDGNINKGFDLPSLAVVGGDRLCPSIAAASILAKVTRDRYCAKIDTLYPSYGFAKHKGYGTKRHIEAIKEFGACKVHRKLFIRKYVNPNISV